MERCASRIHVYALYTHVRCVFDTSNNNTEPAAGENTANFTSADSMLLQATPIFRIAHACAGGTDSNAPLSLLGYLKRSFLGFLTLGVHAQRGLL